MRCLYFKLTAPILISLLFITPVMGQERILDSISFNLHLQAHTAFFLDRIELGETVPRMGTTLFRNVGENTRVFGRLEYGLNLAQGTTFNNDANQPSDFVRDPFQEAEPFSSRLGYVGIEHKTLGSISLGKQWGAYYDIGGFTDGFTSFGSSAVDVYAGNTDGGWKGTGRADEAVVYRNRFNKFQIGLNAQFFGSHTNYASSLTYQATKHLRIGVAYNQANIPNEFRSLVNNLDPRSENFIAGYMYSSPKLYSALTFAYIEDEIKVISEDNFEAFPVYGMEFLNRYQLTDRIKIEAGFNYKWEKEQSTFYGGEYRLLQFYGGINYYFGELFSMYIQGRIDDSRFLTDVESANALLIGLSFDFFKSIWFYPPKPPKEEIDRKQKVN